MRMLLMAVAVSFGLAGCTTSSGIDGNKLADICRRASAAMTAFNLASLFLDISPAIKTRATQAWAVLEPFCEDPQQSTTPAMLRKAGTALDRLEAAREAAK